MSDQAQSLAVITGGASGIGLALAEAYAVRGHAVLLGDIDTEALASAKEKFCLPGAVVHTAEVDLRSATSVFELKEKAQSLGSIAAVCFNAGTTVSGTPIWNTDIDLFDHIAAVNFVRPVSFDSSVRSRAYRTTATGRCPDNRLDGGDGRIGLQRGVFGE